VTDHFAVGDRVVLDADFRAARARLEILARDQMLPGACGMAYGEGITGMVKLAGPADARHAGRLARLPVPYLKIVLSGR